MDGYKKHISQREFVRIARERCIDIEKHIETFEMMYLEFTDRYDKYLAREAIAEQRGEKLILQPHEIEDCQFLESNIKRNTEVLDNYKNQMAQFRVLIMSSEILGDKAFYTIDGDGGMLVSYASRDEIGAYREHMKEVDKCYQ